MTDIALRPNTQIVDTFLRNNPNAGQGWKRAADIMARIRSWDDVETYLLRGAGLSPRTYAAYLSAVKGLYQYTGGLTPFQVTPGHVEGYIDSLAKRGCRPNSRAAHAYGLQRFFKSVAELAPGWVSPFACMTPALRRKLFKTNRVETKRALGTEETRALLAWLREADPKAYGLVALLVGTGLRASEACSLTWADVEHDQDAGAWFVVGVGKGSKPFRQEVGIPEALEALAKGSGREGPLLRRADGRPMDRQALHYQVSRVGAAAEAAHVVTGTRRIQWSPHLFRRTYATVLYHAGVKVKALAELTRHASVETLSAHYLDDRERSAPVFARVFAEATA